MTLTENQKEVSEKMAGYKGVLDENCMRAGYGEEVIRRNHGNEYYKGNFKNDAYHGVGFYKNDSIFNAKWSYEGQFFSNAKEGYGRLSLPDNIYFDGLYERDRPFGPGVLTRGNGEQEVGYWQSSSIIRLIQPINSGVIDLSTKPTHKVLMMKFKKLVEVAPPSNLALQVTNAMNLPDEVASKLYSIYCKEPNNFLFNYEEFEQVYFNDLKKVEDLIPILSEDDFSQATIGETTETAHGEVTNNSVQSSALSDEKLETETDATLSWDRLRKRTNLLVSWNNTPIVIDIMVHTFINRIYEKTAGFNIEDLLCNCREKFESPGPQERACTKLLESSDKGDLRELTWLLLVNKLNINVQDSKGNGCVIRAASQDHHSLLYLLFLYGANMDIFNDEGFTALNYTLTRYLALVHSVEDWGNAFLPQSKIISPKKARLWRKCDEKHQPRISKASDKRRATQRLSATKFSSSTSDVTHRTSEERHYIFDLKSEENRRAHKHKFPQKEDEAPSQRGIRRRGPFTPAGMNKKSQGHSPEKRTTEEDGIEKLKKLNVRRTLELLLSFKIDPNASNVPQPAIMLAIFSGDFDLVKVLLEAGANPNARFLPEEGWLTPLHILVLAKPHPSLPAMMDILLEYGANPNAQAAVDFAPKTKEFILHGYSETDFPIVGQTPLQALLLREDATYVSGKEILKELLLKLHYVTAKEPKYFGHSFLSLAVVRMNMAFVFTLLHIFSEDANEELHPLWGNIATAYLTYLGKKKEPETIITLIELEQAGMNPLRIVRTVDTEEEENVINFAYRMEKLDDATKPNLHSKSQTDAQRKSELMKLSTPNRRKSTTVSSRRNSIEHPRISRMTQRDGSVSTTRTKASNASKNKFLPKRRVEKELLKKVTLLRDLGRDKVDNHIRGVVLRRFLKSLKNKDIHDEEMNIKDYTVEQMVNWFYSEEEFLTVLSHNILAGLTFISESDACRIFRIEPWKHKERFQPVSSRKIQRDSLNCTDKVEYRELWILLTNLKEAIKTQLEEGVSIENINLIKKKRVTSSHREKHKSRTSGTQSDVSKLQPYRNSKTEQMPEILDEHRATVDEVARTENQTIGSLHGKNIEDEIIKVAEEKNKAKLLEFIDKLQPLLTMCAPQVRWTKHYGTKFLKIPKRALFNTDSFPEVDKNPDLYRVCYKCVRRDPDLELCPMCKLVWYCSRKCNTRDIMNVNSHHRCKEDFYGRGSAWRLYSFDEAGILCRIPRAGQEDWEAGDILEDALLKKYGKKDMIPRNDGGSSAIKKSYVNNFGDNVFREHGSSDRSRLQGANGSGSTGQKKPSVRKPATGKGSTAMSIGDVNNRGMNGRTSNKRGWKEQSKLREKKELHLREARKLREMRHRLPKGVMGDFMRWGFIRMQSIRDSMWYKRQEYQQRQGTLKQGEMESSDYLSESYFRLVHQLKVLQGLAGLLGSKFDMNNLFPWVVLRNGELYYKFNQTSFVLENYSFN